MRQSIVLTLCCCLLLLLITCSGGGGGSETPTTDTGGGTTDTSFKRDDMLQNLSANVMYAAYVDFANQAKDLDLAAQAFVGEPSSLNFDQLRLAFQQTTLAYKNAEMFNIGTIDTLRLDNQVHFWPIRQNTIQAALLDTTPIDASYMENLGVGGKGLGTLEYLLYATKANQAPLTWLSNPDAPRRLDFLRGVTLDLATQADRMLSIWSPDGENLVNALADATDGTEAYGSFREALSEIVNQLVYDLEFVRNNKVGKPLGVDSGGTPQPDLVEFPYAHFSHNALRANLQACLALFAGDLNGNDGPGLSEYLTFLESDLGPQIVAQMRLSIQQLDAIQGDLATASQQRSDNLQQLYDTLNELVLTTKVDMASTMGVSITFNDNDGD